MCAARRDARQARSSRDLDNQRDSQKRQRNGRRGGQSAAHAAPLTQAAIQRLVDPPSTEQAPAAGLSSQEILSLQRTVGNQAVQRLLNHKDGERTGQSPPARRMVVDPDPAAERRAQQTAGAIQTGDGQGRMGSSTPRAARPSNKGDTVDPAIANEIDQARGRGRPLDASVRPQLEQALGAKFDKVRIHAGLQADRLNRALDASAFTTERDIFMRRGRYSPHTRDGQHLLAHELTHVVQQTGGAGGQVQRQTSGGTLQRAKGYSHIPGAGMARGAVFGESQDRQKLPTDLSPDFLSEVKLTPVTVKNKESRFLRKGKVYELKGFLYEPKQVAYNNTTVLALSGSGGSSESYMRPMAERYVRMGCRVVAVNYRGFGESRKEGKPGTDRGTPTEKGAYSDAMAIYQALVSGQYGLPATPPNEILIHGYSLGGPIAAALTERIGKKNRKNPAGAPKGLLLDRAMSSTYKAAKSEVAAPAALGAKAAVGSFSTKNRLKGIKKNTPNLPIVFTSASATADHAGDLDIDLDLNTKKQSTLFAIYNNTAQSNDVAKLQKLVKTKSKSKDDLAADDAALAQWAQNKGMSSSHVGVADATHFSHDKIMNSLAPELFNRGLIQDQGGGAWQNPSNLKRTRARGVQDVLNRRIGMNHALSAMQELQIQLNTPANHPIVDQSLSALKADAIAHQQAVNQLLQSGTKDDFLAASDLAESLKDQLKRDAVGRLTVNAELIASSYFSADNPFAVLQELMGWINGMNNGPDAAALRHIHSLLTYVTFRY